MDEIYFKYIYGINLNKFIDLLPFYAILRSIPNKLLGVIAMFSAILAIMLLPVTDLGRSKGSVFMVLSLNLQLL
jgi:ubiquinol-cytochrome c reductase cytochrome b subunit